MAIELRGVRLIRRTSEVEFKDIEGDVVEVVIGERHRYRVSTDEVEIEFNFTLHDSGRQFFKQVNSGLHPDLKREGWNVHGPYLVTT